MTRSVRDLEQEVRALDVAERNRLLRDLIADMDGESQSDVERAWLQEAKRRFDELQKGFVEPVPAAEVFRKARSRLKHEG